MGYHTLDEYLQGKNSTVMISPLKKSSNGLRMKKKLTRT